MVSIRPRPRLAALRSRMFILLVPKHLPYVPNYKTCHLPRISPTGLRRPTPSLDLTLWPSSRLVESFFDKFWLSPFLHAGNRCGISDAFGNGVRKWSTLWLLRETVPRTGSFSQSLESVESAVSGSSEGLCPLRGLSLQSKNYVENGPTICAPLWLIVSLRKS